jgi:hypothetical protein
LGVLYSHRIYGKIAQLHAKCVFPLVFRVCALRKPHNPKLWRTNLENKSGFLPAIGGKFATREEKAPGEKNAQFACLLFSVYSGAKLIWAAHFVSLILFSSFWRRYAARIELWKALSVIQPQGDGLAASINEG